MSEAHGSRGGCGSEWFSAEIAKHVHALRLGAKVITRNEDSAADLMQETLTKAWAARSTFTPGTNMKAWLFTIMRNQFRSDMRRAWRQVAWDQESAERIPGPRDEQDWSIELGEVARAIGTLSKCQREAVILAGVGDFSNKDIGLIVGCGTAAVKSRVARARHRVRLMIDGAVPFKKTRGNAAWDTTSESPRPLPAADGECFVHAEFPDPSLCVVGRKAL